MFVVCSLVVRGRRLVALDNASSRQDRTCMNVVGGDHTCLPERQIMEADQKAYANAMSSGLRDQS